MRFAVDIEPETSITKTTSYQPQFNFRQHLNIRKGSREVVRFSRFSTKAIVKAPLVRKLQQHTIPCCGDHSLSKSVLVFLGSLERIPSELRVSPTKSRKRD